MSTEPQAVEIDDGMFDELAERVREVFGDEPHFGGVEKRPGRSVPSVTVRWDHDYLHRSTYRTLNNEFGDCEFYTSVKIDGTELFQEINITPKE